MSNLDFISGCLSGDFLPEEVDDFVDEWHNKKPAIELYRFLGMTRREYELWAEDDGYIPLIIAARRQNRDIDDYVDEVESYSMAARASGGADVKKLMEWLKVNGHK